MADDVVVVEVVRDTVEVIQPGSGGPAGPGLPPGGTTDQIPAKASDADYHVAWTDLAAVAWSGSYGDLSGTPTLGSAAAAATTDFDAAGTAAAAVTALASTLGGAALLNVGTATGTVAAGDDSRLSDARTPIAHAASHAAAGSDPVTVAESQVTGLTAALAAKVSAALFDANTILAATTDNTPAALTVPASTLVGRAATGDIAALTPAVVRALLNVVDLSTLGNLLTAAQATPSTGAYTLSGCTESGALVLTATGSGALTASVASIPVTAGVVYSVRADLACVGRSAAVRISWRNSGGAEIAAVAGDTIAAGASGESMATGLAPSGAVTMTAYAAYSATGAAGDTVTVTRAGVWVGAGGLWVPPGFAVPDLGICTTRPNVDDVWVRAWSGRGGDPAASGQWQTTHYDSGWRDVRGMTCQHGTVANAQLRRTNATIFCRIDWTNDTSAGDRNTITLPAGFLAHVSSFSGYFTWLDPVAGNAVRLGFITTAGSISIKAAAASTRYVTEFALPTQSTIPPALPGTLVSSAPA